MSNIAWVCPYCGKVEISLRALLESQREREEREKAEQQKENEKNKSK